MLFPLHWRVFSGEHTPALSGGLKFFCFTTRVFLVPGDRGTFLPPGGSHQDVDLGITQPPGGDHPRGRRPRWTPVGIGGTTPTLYLSRLHYVFIT